MGKRIAIVLVVVLAAVGGYFGWRALQSEQAANGALTGSGTIEAQEVVVSSLAGGRILKAPVEGARVKKDDVLFEVDAALAKLAVKQAEEGVRAAQAQLDQAEDDDASSAELAVAEARLEQAKLAADAARVQLGYTVVRAPLDGLLANVAADAGENAVPGQTLATLSDLAHLQVSVFVPETEIGKVKVGDKAALTTDSTSGAFDCRVSFVASEAEFTPANIETKDQRAKLVYEVRLDIEGSPSELKPGMPADVSFE